MQPKGLWQRRRPLPSRTAAVTIFPPLKPNRPQPHAGHTGANISPSPHNTKQTSKPTRLSPPAPLLLHLLRAGLNLRLGVHPTLLSPPSWVTGASCSGTSGGVAPLSLRGRGGDLHPLANRRPPSWQHRRQPVPHGTPRNSHTWPPRAGTGGPYPLYIPRQGIGGRS